ncbi:SDR family NAD(P)-dependent oxidoreductase [Trebonia kvetii]|uniref:SDR family NAD(P)-dependent oxidoreductase n=1 Tax=Trebonia kvetii TaxID=2480626 RepID=A0A6P2BYA5_9ACTN|nr:SDR family NAD(P)-dependent oxidoreductase [Trebonia kvetii]TVZ02173.1 SDR family NAD(P)-dependent oxidoreductase [Trebonia kvetii]
MTATDLSQYGPWAVVTGGSEGVGAAFSRQLAEAGFNLVLAARKPGPLEETAAACRGYGTEVRTVEADLTDPDGLARIVDAADGLEVGLLVQNAGANTHSRPFLDGDLAAFRRVIDLNITATLGLVHHFGQPMRERGRGGILLTGSISSHYGAQRLSVYNACKAFVRIFSEALWVELREHGVQVLALELGVTRTPAMARIGLNFDTPGFVVGEPEDVAREGLAHLPDGPVHVVSGNAAQVAQADQPDRAAVVLGAYERTRQLLSR